MCEHIKNRRYINPFHTLTSIIFKFQFNIISPSGVTILFFRVFLTSHACYMLNPSNLTTGYLKTVPVNNDEVGEL